MPYRHNNEDAGADDVLSEPNLELDIGSVYRIPGSVFFGVGDKLRHRPVELALAEQVV